MKTKYISLTTIVAVLCLLCSCEVTLPNSDLEQPDEVKIAASALIMAGDTVKMRLAYTESIYERASEVYEDRSMLLRALMVPDTVHAPADKYLMKKYYDELLLRVGDVILTTGAGEQLPMVFNPETFDFECVHKAVPGEVLHLTAEVASREGKLLKISSSTTVPGWTPKAEITEVTRLYKETLTREDLDVTEFTNDSVYEVKIHLHDSSKDLHCYRLRVRGVGYHYEGDTIIHSPEWQYYFDTFFPYLFKNYREDYIEWIDAFFTNDPLLYDQAITHNFGAWQAHTTDVFTNRDFPGEDYIITVQTRVPNMNRRFIDVFLQPICPDLKNYLSSLYRVRSSQNGYFSEPGSISSNIDGGVGIFGSMGEPLHIRYFIPGHEDPEFPNGGHKKDKPQE